MHENIDSPIKNTKDLEDLIELSAKMGVVYFAINYVLNECEDHHMSVGASNTTCPICGKNIIGKYTRPVGFITKIDNWVPERREQDFPNRKFYSSIKVN